MAAYYCPDCEIPYPKSPEYDDCPDCGTTTKYRSALEPDPDIVSAAERRKRHVEFEKWCEENWNYADPTISAIRFHFPHTKKDALVASEVIRQMDDRGLFVGELHVFETCI